MEKKYLKYFLLLFCLMSVEMIFSQSPDPIIGSGPIDPGPQIRPYVCCGSPIVGPCIEAEPKLPVVGYTLKPGTSIKPGSSKIVLGGGPFFYKHINAVSQSIDLLRSGDLIDLDISKIGKTIVHSTPPFGDYKTYNVPVQYAGNNGFKDHDLISIYYILADLFGSKYYEIEDLEYTSTLNEVKLSGNQSFGGLEAVICSGNHAQAEHTLLTLWNSKQAWSPYTPQPEDGQKVIEKEIKASSKISGGKLSFVDYPSDRINQKVLQYSSGLTASSSSARVLNSSSSSSLFLRGCPPSFCIENPNAPCCRNAGPLRVPGINNPNPVSPPFVGSSFTIPIEDGNDGFLRIPAPNRPNFDNGGYNINLNSSELFHLGKPDLAFGLEAASFVLNLLNIGNETSSSLPAEIEAAVIFYGPCNYDLIVPTLESYRDRVFDQTGGVPVSHYQDIIGQIDKLCENENKRLANEAQEKAKEIHDSNERNRIRNRNNALGNNNIYKYRFGPGGDALAVNPKEKQLVDAIKSYLDPDQRTFPSLEEAISRFTTKRVEEILTTIEDDYRWELVNDIDEEREAIFAINEQLASSNSNSIQGQNLLKQKKFHFDKIRDRFRKLDGLQDYPRDKIADDLFVGQIRHFFDGGITNESELLDAFNKVTAANDPILRETRDHGWDVGRIADVRNAVDNEGDIGASPPNPNIDYEVLKLEIDNKFNANSEPFRSFKNWLDGQKDDVIKYLETNRNSRESVRRIRHLSERWSDAEPLVIHPDRLKSAGNLQTQSLLNPNLALTSDLAVEPLNNGFKGFNNLLNSFLDDIPESNKSNIFEGHLIRQYFDANDFNLSLLNDMNIASNYGEVFEFAITDDFKINVSFQNDLGNAFLTNGFNLDQVIEQIESSNIDEFKDLKNCVSGDDCGEEKLWYLDADSDGYHSETRSSSTKPGEKWVLSTEGDDCDDDNPKVHEANKTLSDIELFKSPTQPGLAGADDQSGIARDYREGDLTVEELNNLIDTHIQTTSGPKGSDRGPVAQMQLKRRLADLMLLSDDELFDEMENAAWLSLIYQSTIGNGLGDFTFEENYASNLAMISRFREDSKGVVDTPEALSAMLGSDSSFTSFLGDLTSDVENLIKGIDNIDEIENLKLSDLNPPTFNTGGNFFNWNGSWTINVNFKNVTLDCAELKGSIDIDVYDQFGLDDADLFTAPSSKNARQLDGIWAWFILQRIPRDGRKNYAPFINHFNSNSIIEVTIK